MGVLNGRQLLYIIGPVSSSQLHTVASARAEKAGRKGRPVVAIDFSWLCFALMGSTVKETTNRIIGFILMFIREGVSLIIVYDPDIRHHSKKASIAREAKRQRSIVEAIRLKTKILAISNTLRLETYETVEEKKILIEQRKDHDSKVKTLERDSLRRCSAVYIDSIREAVEELKLVHAGQVSTVEGKYQADSYIQHLASQNKVDLVVGNDADFSVVAGALCVQILSFKLLATKTKSKNKEAKGTTYDIGNIEIGCGSSSVIADCGAAIGVNCSSVDGKPPSVMFTAAKYPLLDGIQDIRTRCLIGVVLGSDTLPAELKKHTIFNKMAMAAVRNSLVVVRREKNLSPVSDVAYDDLLKQILKVVPKKNREEKQDLGKDAITAFVEAMAYEPGLILESGERLYVQSAPSESISNYIEDFAPSSDLVKCDAKLLECPGPCAGKNHQFMEAEGSFTCSTCNRNYCRICLQENNTFCTPCLSEDTVSTSRDPVSLLSEKELRQALDDKIEVPATATVSDLQELYSIYIVDDAMDSLESTLDSVKYPTHPPAALKDGTITVVSRFDLCDGARFLGDRRLKPIHKCKISILLSKLVTFTQPEKDDKLPAAAEVLPDILVQFANGSRVDTGERLMKRCVRHAIDTKCPPITNGSGCVFELDGDIGLTIHGGIPPSFKGDGMYEVTTALTSSALVAATCTCKAGPEKKKSDEMEDEATDHDKKRKHICVHSLPILYKLAILLIDGLAEHALVELASFFGASDERELSSEDRDNMATALRTLMEAAECADAPLNLDTPTELLEHFKVGTERARSNIPDPPDPCELGPLRNYKRKTPEEKAKVKLKLKKENGAEGGSADTTNERYKSPYSFPVDGTPDYFATWRLCETLSSYAANSTRADDDRINKVIGHRILDLRAQATSHTQNTISLIDAGLKPRVSNLIRTAEERTPKPRGLLLPSAVVDLSEEDAHSSSESPNVVSASATASTEVKNRPYSWAPRKTCQHQDCGASLDGKPTRKVPAIPPKPVAKKAGETISKDRWKTYYKKRFRRHCFLDRMGIRKSDPRYNEENIRMCQSHSVVTVRKSYQFSYMNKKTGDTKTQSATDSFVLPDDAGPKNNRPGAPTNSLSKGLGGDRLTLSLLKKDVTEQKSNPDLAAASLVIVQQAEIYDGGRSSVKSLVNPTVLKEAKLDIHLPSPPKKQRVEDETSASGNRKMKPPFVTPDSLTDKEVKRRTGFESKSLLLQYIAIVCNGDVEVVQQTESNLTWFEEWFIYFEMGWGKTCIRWQDGEEEYGINERRVRDIFHAKLAKVVIALLRWPRFVTHAEDMELRTEKWRQRYGERRAQMWDNTNVDFMGKPTDPDLQRLTYSQYYGGNVAKGGVFLQLCGWLGGWPLWLGAVSDTDYFENSELLEKQEDFQKTDTTSPLSFTNILDKGYRSILAAWRAGGQLLLQPFFAKSDRQFTSKEVLLSAVVATDRSANERAVKRLKASGLISRGIHPRQDLVMISDFWLAWGFQCNFMYKPVL